MKNRLFYLFIAIALTSNSGQAASFNKLFPKKEISTCVTKTNVKNKRVLILDIGEDNYLNNHRHLSPEVTDLIKSDTFDIIIIDGHADGLGSSLQQIADIIPNLKKLKCFQFNLTGSICRGINPFNEYKLLIQKIFNSPQPLKIELKFVGESDRTNITYMEFTIN
ncbi:hypothetical protein JKY79_01690 [Candidatus Babeliales bacterium]|nr:hypothetical protein [Candidatus Babeliales bacterium]